MSSSRDYILSPVLDWFFFSKEHRFAFSRLLKHTQEMVRLFVVVVFVVLLGAPLTDKVVYAMSTKYVGAHMSKMPSARSKYKPYEKREPARASSFLVYLLLERIWMTEYHGHPIDRQAGFHETCIDQIEQSINQKEGPIALGTVRGPSDIPFDPPESAKSKRVWEFRCSPIKIISVPKFGGRAVEHLEYQILAFNGVERVVPALVEILKTGKLGRYRISRAEAERMVFGLVDAFPTLKQSLFPKTISLLANHPFLDGDAWDDTPENDLIPEVGSRQEFTEKMRRLSNTGLLSGDYKVLEGGSHITVSIPIYDDFY